MQSGFSNVAKIASTFASYAANILIATLATVVFNWVATEVGKIIDDMLHHSENIIKAGEEAKNKIDDIYSEFENVNKEINDMSISFNIDNADMNTTKENLDALAERYAELKDGVNNFSNANKSLTTEKYEEYLKISNELAKKFPTLVRGYDS